MPDRPSDESPLWQQLTRRRDEMLAELLPEVPRAAARRRARRVGALAVGGVATVALAALLLPSVPQTPSSPVQPLAKAPDPIAPTIRGTPHTDVAMLATDPGIVERLAVIEHSFRVEHISDEVLLRTLSAIGRPAALVATANGPRLTADVVDPPRSSM